MPQRTNSYPSLESSTQAITDVDKISPPPKSTSKPLPAAKEDNSHRRRRAPRCENNGEKAPERPDTPCQAPQGWEPELPDFDWTASPGADEWKIGQTVDGCAVYSAVTGTGVGVTVEFQKWDW